MKYKKVIIPSIIILVAVSMWASIPISSERIEGVFADVNLDDLVNESELVIIGTLNSQRIEDTTSDTIPLRSVTNIQVLEVVKGQYSDLTIDVIDWAEGPTFKNGYRTEVYVEIPLAEFHPSEKVLLFLYHDTENIAGAGYYIDGSAQGKYTINGDKAIGHTPDRNTTLKDIRDRLS